MRAVSHVNKYTTLYTTEYKYEQRDIIAKYKQTADFYTNSYL